MFRDGAHRKKVEDVSLIITRRRFIKLAGGSLLLPSQARAITHGLPKYPILNTSSPLAYGMVGAYFPGYGVPVVDATRTWCALRTSAYGTAGSLTTNGVGRGMSFDGLLNGVWATGSGFPLASASGVTIAVVCQVTGPCHYFGTFFGIFNSRSSDPNERLTLAWDTYPQTVPSGNGVFYMNPDCNNINNMSVYANYVMMPTEMMVYICTLDFAGLTANVYQNGALANRSILRSGTSLSGFDTIAIGCRKSTTIGRGESVTLTKGSNIGISTGNGTEDIFIGSAVTDAVGALPAGTYVTNYDENVTWTFSQAASGYAASDALTFPGPFTRLKNGVVNSAMMWNRILDTVEIVAYSNNPMGPFYMPL